MSHRTGIPTYSRHQSGQAYCYVNRKMIYLGRYGSAESKQRFQSILDQLQQQPPKKIKLSNGDRVVLATVIARRLRWLKENNAKPWTIECCLKMADTLIPMYGEASVNKFGVPEIEEWRNTTLKNGSRQEHRKGKKVSANSLSVGAQKGPARGA